MTPKEKAEELLCKFSIFPDGNNDIVKECAIICVKEIIKEIACAESVIWWGDVIEEIRKYK